MWCDMHIYAPFVTIRFVSMLPVFASHVVPESHFWYLMVLLCYYVLLSLLLEHGCIWKWLKMAPPNGFGGFGGYTIFRQTYMSPGGCTILKLGTDICSFHIRGTCTMAIFAATMKSMELGVAKLTCGDAANTLCQCNQVNTSFPHLRGTVYTAMRWGWLTMNLFSLFI